MLQSSGDGEVKGHGGGSEPVGAQLLGLLVAAHPLPTVAVTTFATVLAAGFGGRGGLLVLVAAATFTGHLCIGWCNDVVDAERDRVAGRGDKPVAAGRVERGIVLGAAVVAGVACVPLSLLTGVLAGTLHLVSVGSALGYNLGLKSTAVSPLTYVVGFGLLPGFTSQAAGAGWPPAGTFVAAGLLGAAAHAANTVGDARADEVAGVRGLPQRLGPRVSLTFMPVLVAAAAIVLLPVILADGWSARAALGVVLLAAGALLAAGSVVGRVGEREGRTAFRLTLAAIAFVVAGFVVAVTHSGA